MSSRIKTRVFFLLVLVLLGLQSGAIRVSPAHGANLPLLQVWSPDTHSTNITSTSSQFQPGGKFTVDVNITNAGPVSGFDITLHYAMSNFFAPPILASDNSLSLAGGLFDPSGSCNVQVALQEQLGFPLYRVRYAAVYLGVCSAAAAHEGTGLLFSVQFDVVGANTTSIDILRTGPTPFAKQLLMTSGPPDFHPIDFEVTDMIFSNVAGTLPVSQFTYSPAFPFLADNVTLDATGSYYPGQESQPDRGIKRIIWSFNDASPNVEGNFTTAGIINHRFLLSATQFASGFCAVRLVVFGSDDRLPMRMEQIVYVSPVRVYDAGVSINISRVSVLNGQTTSASVTIGNLGNVNVEASLNVSIDNSAALVGHQSSILLSVSQRKVFNYTVVAQDLSIGIHNITAIVSLGNSSTTVQDANPADNVAIAQFFVTTGIHPTAEFVISPASPVVGEQVKFDASASTDPDGHIAAWYWDFGDVYPWGGVLVYHQFSTPGTYNVTLQVQGQSGLSGFRSQLLTVRPIHDVKIVSVDGDRHNITVSGLVNIRIGLANNGNSSETFDLTVYYGAHVAGTRSAIVLPPGPDTQYYTIQWNTTGVTPGTYTLSAKVVLPDDYYQDNNNLSGKAVTVLPSLQVSQTSTSEKSFIQNYGLIIAASAIAAVALLVLVAAVRRRSLRKSLEAA